MKNILKNCLLFQVLHAKPEVGVQQSKVPDSPIDWRLELFQPEKLTPSFDFLAGKN